MPQDDRILSQNINNGVGLTRILVVKVASRCNLSCTYCYMYEHPDQSWKNQPKFMARDTVERLVNRIEEYAIKYPLEELMVVLHGGEPLLYKDMEFFLSELSAGVKSTKIAFAIQTNGILLGSSNIPLLRTYEVRIGVSVDGSAKSHNKTRVMANGKASYDKVRSGIQYVNINAPELLDSVLQVIDPSVHPLEMLELVEAYGVSRMDLLFPDLNHDTMPSLGLSPGELGEWLVSVFDEWVVREDGVHIRFFLTIIHLLLGGRHGTDQLGAYSTGAMMIETNGDYVVYDALKTAYPGAGSTALNVSNASIEDAEFEPLVNAFRNKASAANSKCLDCRLFFICGGGCLIHRYSKKSGFDMPSVFCKDLMRIIEHIGNYLSGNFSITVPVSDQGQLTRP